MTTVCATTKINFQNGHALLSQDSYCSVATVPLEARERFQPWWVSMTFAGGEPTDFISFGGRKGMIDVACHLLGPERIGIHGGIFEALESLVTFDLDANPLAGEQLFEVAQGLDALLASPTRNVDFWLFGSTPARVRNELARILLALEEGRDVIL